MTFGLVICHSDRKDTTITHILPPQRHTHVCGRGLLGFSTNDIPECPWLIDKCAHRMIEPCGWVTSLGRLKHLFTSNREGGDRAKKESVKSTLVNY